MSNYTITTDFGAKDNLPSGNAAKVIKGSEFSVEFTNIKTAVNSKADLNAPNFTGAVDFASTVDIVGDLTVDTNTFHVDVTNNRVGIGKTNPATALDITGTVTASGLTVDTDTLHVDASNDRVGIGTTSPAGKLHVSNGTSGATVNSSADDLVIESATNAGISILGDGNETQYLMFGDAANSTIGRVLYDHNTNHMALWTNANERMLIDSSGNVGIGTDSPNKKLHIKDGSVRIESTFPRLYLTDTNNDSDFSIINAEGNFGIYDDTNLDYRFRINSSGNVGIGTTNPATTLDVAGTVTADGLTVASPTPSPEITIHDTDATYGFVLSQFNSGDGVLKTNNTERVRITNEGNVGIGTTSPSEKLETYEGNISIKSTTASQETPYYFMRTDSGQSADYVASIGMQAATESDWRGVITFNAKTSSAYNNSTVAERMRIDSSGNLLVGKTSGAFSDEGHAFYKTGLTQHTRDNATVLQLNRLTSEGSLVTFNKDGSSVGSIGLVSSDNLYIQGNSTHHGLSFGTNAIVAFKNGNYSDAVCDLGTTDTRFKDIYLSGGVHLGGTGDANKLDDYEEGTWTPNLYGSTSGVASPLSYSSAETQYTKVGRLVYFNAYITDINAAGHSLTGEFRISGLPFTASRHAPITVAHTDLFTFDEADISVGGYVNNGSTYIAMRKGSSKTGFTVTSLQNNNTSDLMISGSYTTT